MTSLPLFLSLFSLPFRPTLISLVPLGSVNP